MLSLNINILFYHIESYFVFFLTCNYFIAHACTFYSWWLILVSYYHFNTDMLSTVSLLSYLQIIVLYCCYLKIYLIIHNYACFILYSSKINTVINLLYSSYYTILTLISYPYIFCFFSCYYSQSIVLFIFNIFYLFYTNILHNINITTLPNHCINIQIYSVCSWLYICYNVKLCDIRYLVMSLVVIQV